MFDLHFLFYRSVRRLWFVLCLIPVGCIQATVADVFDTGKKDSERVSDTNSVDDNEADTQTNQDSDKTPEIVTDTETDTSQVSPAMCVPVPQTLTTRSVIRYPPACGDGEINQIEEECDDGNTLPGDGCNGICKIDPNFICDTPGELCKSIYVCGNGVLDPGELCDDGNTIPNDGCSEQCDVWNYHYDCSVIGESCILLYACGDLRIEGLENCEDGNTPNLLVSGDGCDENCQTEPGWVCPYPSQPCIQMSECEPDCTFPAYCGNGIVDLPEEECDDGINDGSYSNCGVDCLFGPRCGDGILDPEHEECDDGNTVSKDGCSARCKIDGCGDGVVDTSINPDTGQPREQCDDGINEGSYGECAPGCVLGPYCGDGIVYAEINQKTGVAYEQCDDGVNDNGYGACSPGCTLGPHCGDGIVQPGYEECDEPENTNGYPGCVMCKKTYCGDKIVQAPFEMCDDGNTVNNDNCDNSCQCTPP